MIVILVYSIENCNYCIHFRKKELSNRDVNIWRWQQEVCLFMHFSNAFDLVDHDLLLQKLRHCCLRGIIHGQLSSYLPNRKEIVVFGNSTSYEQSIKYGVPQGSILWRLMFLLFLMISHAKLTVATWFFAPIILDMLVKMEIQPVWSDICSQHWINFLFGLTTIVYGWIPRKLFIY